MGNFPSILTVIPARGGSKGLPGKNLMDFKGKPLIAWTILSALKCQIKQQVVVSSEDPEILSIAAQFGAHVPFVRPMELAADDTPGIDPILHTLTYYQAKGGTFDYVVCLQCTSPLRDSRDIDEAISLGWVSHADGVVSVCEAEYSPFWMKNIRPDGTLEAFVKDAPAYARRQDLPKVYRLNGAFYMAKPKILLEQRSWYSQGTLAYVMSQEKSVDIDNEMGFLVAEKLFDRMAIE